MKPVPANMLIAVVLMLCALCGWQWHREGLLRRITVDQAALLTSLEASLQESENRNKSSNAEILQLTGLVVELRGQPDASEELAVLKNSHEELKKAFESQSAKLQEQNESLSKADGSVRTANDSIRQLMKERDSLAERLNDLTRKYNKTGNR